jgi:putative DNA primase/helicase
MIKRPKNNSYCVPSYGISNCAGRAVYICFDSDAGIKPELRHASVRLFLLLSAAGANVHQLTSWDGDSGKGIDDFLIASIKEDPGTTAAGLLDVLIADANLFIDTIQNNKVDLDIVEAELVKVALSPTYKAQLCKELAKHLKVPAATLRKVVQDKSEDAAFTLTFTKAPEPWPEAVDGAKLLHALKSFVVRYVAVNNHNLTAIAAWIVLTYLINEVDILPILGITSPEKRCGKTRLLQVLGSLVQRPLSASNVSTAAIYRVIEQWSPTLLVDEADTFLKDDDVMRGIINSGHTRQLAYVLRVGSNGLVEQLSTWAPKAIAMIGDLPTTIADRCILVRLARRAKSEVVQPLRNIKGAEVVALQRKLARWTNDYREEIAFAEPSLPNIVNDRAADNWIPLLKIAQVAGGDWPTLALEALKGLNAVEHDEDSVTTILLASLHAIFQEGERNFVSTDEIIVRLNENKSAPWADWRAGKGMGMSAKKLGDLLRRFEIKSVFPRINGEPRQHGYEWGKVAPVVERYAPQKKSDQQKEFDA